MFIGSNTNIGIIKWFSGLFILRQTFPNHWPKPNDIKKITKASGAVIINYGVLQTHTVTGGASFTASNTVATNTTGWTASWTSSTYYWIGGSVIGMKFLIGHLQIGGGVSNGCKIPEPGGQCSLWSKFIYSCQSICKSKSERYSK